jgi:hypothetical protein
MNPMPAINIVMTPMNIFAGIKAGLRRLALIFLLALPLAATAVEQRTFATPEAAVDALLAALKARDEAALTAIFGDKHKEMIASGDAAQNAADRAKAAEALAAFRVLDSRGEDRRVLLMGVNAWPFPIPLVRNCWRLALRHRGGGRGTDQPAHRRQREPVPSESCVPIIDAQRQYASVDRDGDGVLQYAQKLASTEGKQDGLYWPADPAKGEEESPFGPLIAASSAYLKGHTKGDPFRGYHFRVLTRQGKSAAGGAYNYVINGRMIAGFAMVAYPHDYGTTGVMSFIVSHNGKIYQKDLGENSAKTRSRDEQFRPGHRLEGSRSLIRV